MAAGHASATISIAVASLQQSGDTDRPAAKLCTLVLNDLVHDWRELVREDRRQKRQVAGAVVVTRKRPRMAA